eukprot:TCALIF_06314-PA protein Name:"Similar to scat Vacuolar protein sorting-associated protein 54 (Drosophila melanogaster)" AED:0.03 eAED:0.03 QI:253/0.88/0.7/1/1/1/10/0/899
MDRRASLTPTAGGVSGGAGGAGSGPSTSLAASQNLPAVLNNPGKGKQKDFFTRSWGDSFTEHRPLVSPSHLPDVQAEHFERYRRKVHKYASIHERHSPALPPSTPVILPPSSSAKDVDRVFLDPNFDLSRPDTFAAIFKFKPGISLTEQSDSAKLQEQLSHQLDSVEVDIAHQVAQKSHHFFQVMTYHDALMTQLKSLVKLIRNLRANLSSVDEKALQPSFQICQFKRRLSNAQSVLDKLSLMSFLHQTQPTIQVLLTTSEFSGALDLITTSCEIMAVDLKGVMSFRHLTSQLTEIKTIIGKILLEDFQTFISSEIGRETIHIKATALDHTQNSWTEFDTDQLRGVIYGLLRQNSYTFLEALEEASVIAIKSTMKEVVLNCIGDSLPNVKETTLTNLVGEHAQKASSEEWIDLFDVLIGSLIVLQQRIGVIHKVIMESINSANLSTDPSSCNNFNNNNNNNNNNSVVVPEEQLHRLRNTSQEVLINICDQMNERCAKLLTQRSKGASISHITTQELTNIGLLVSIMASESIKQSKRPCTGLQLCLQGQSVMFIQNFHDEQRLKVSQILEKETWKKSTSDPSPVLARLGAIPSMSNLFTTASTPPPPNEPTKTNGEGSHASHASHASSSCFHIRGQDFHVVECVSTFLKILAEYCNLCSMLPSVTVELGLKTADLVKFFNSRVCQLVLGAGAINVSGLKTITIRNLALASRSVDMIRYFIPSILSHFQTCYNEHRPQDGISSLNLSPGSTKAEIRQLEILKRQFDQASKHLDNHTLELFTKIVNVVDSIIQHHLCNWKPTSGVPSASFKALCKQLHKLYESVEDVWMRPEIRRLFEEVHKRLLSAVKVEIRTRGLGNVEHQYAQHLTSELTFYGQCMLRLDVLEETELTRETFERLWKTL